MKIMKNYDTPLNIIQGQVAVIIPCATCSRTAPLVLTVDAEPTGAGGAGI